MFWAFLKHLVVCLFVLQCRRQTHGYDQSNQIMVSRVKGGDLFTVLDLNCDNSKCCLGNVESNVDERRFVNVSGGVCRFQCNTNTPTYLPYERKCVDFSGVLTTTKDLPNCQRWVSINYNHTHTMYTRKMSNVVDLEKGGHIYLGYNGSALLGYDSCSINKSRSAYLNPEGQWKSVSVEQYKFAVAFDHKHGLSTLQWTGVSKKITGLISKIIRLKLLCEKSENKSEDEHFCITFKTKGTVTTHGPKQESTTPQTTNGTNTTPTSYNTKYNAVRVTDYTVSTDYARNLVDGKNPSTPVGYIDHTHKQTIIHSPRYGNQNRAVDHSDKIAVSASVGSVVIVVVVCVVLFFCNSRKRKHVILRSRESIFSKVNAIYERGPDKTIKIFLNGQVQEETDTTEIGEDESHYQPLVQNTILRDASGMQPVYETLARVDANSKLNPSANEYQSLGLIKHSQNEYATLKQCTEGKQVKKTFNECKIPSRSNINENDYDYPD